MEIGNHPPGNPQDELHLICNESRLETVATILMIYYFAATIFYKLFFTLYEERIPKFLYEFRDI